MRHRRLKTCAPKVRTKIEYVQNKSKVKMIHCARLMQWWLRPGPASSVLSKDRMSVALGARAETGAGVRVRVVVGNATSVGREIAIVGERAGWGVWAGTAEGGGIAARSLAHARNNNKVTAAAHLIVASPCQRESLSWSWIASSYQPVPNMWSLCSTTNKYPISSMTVSGFEKNLVTTTSAAVALKKPSPNLHPAGSVAWLKSLPTLSGFG